MSGYSAANSGQKASSTSAWPVSSARPVAAQAANGVNVPNPHMLITQSTPATALKRNGGTEYRTDIAKQMP